MSTPRVKGYEGLGLQDIKITKKQKQTSMGSCGSWNASLSLAKRIGISQKEENSSEAIEKFIEKNGDRLTQSKSFDELKNDDILIGISIVDEDEYIEEEISMKELGLENVNAKEFIKNKVYENHSERFEEDLLEIVEIEDWTFEVEVKDLASKLKFLNLKVLGENISGWDPSTPTFITDEQSLAGCSGWIYCGNDNSDSDSFTVTQKFINSLSVGDKLVLTGDGDGEHC